MLFLAGYLVLSAILAVSALFRVSVGAGLYLFAASNLFLVAGGGFKASVLWGDRAQKIGGAVFAGLLAALAWWLAAGFSVTLFGYWLPGRTWGWIGFAIGVLFTTRRIAGMQLAHDPTSRSVGPAQ